MNTFRYSLVPAFASLGFARGAFVTGVLAIACVVRVVAAESSLADEEKKYLRLAAETIKKFEDAPAAEQQRFISQEADRFAKQYPRGFIYLRASVQEWQADPEAYHAKWPDVFKGTNEPTAISVPPKTITADTVFYDEPVVFANDSEWKVLGAVNVGKNLRSASPLIKGMTTEGRYVVVVYTVKNMTGKPQMVALTPRLSDADGNTYDSLNEDALYVEELTGAKSITIEQLPNKLPKKFAAIYEMPDEQTPLFFDARELGKVIKPEIKKISLAQRPQGNQVAITSTTSVKSLSKRRSIAVDDMVFKPDEDSVFVVVVLSLAVDAESTPKTVLKHPSGVILNPDRDGTSALRTLETKALADAVASPGMTAPNNVSVVFQVPRELATKNDWVLRFTEAGTEVPIKLSVVSEAK